MAYTVEQIVIEGLVVTNLRELELISRPNEHTVLQFCGCV